MEALLGLLVNVEDGKISVRQKGSTYCVSYKRAPHAPLLVRNGAYGPRDFLLRAWQVANIKGAGAGVDCLRASAAFAICKEPQCKPSV